MVSVRESLGRGESSGVQAGCGGCCCVCTLLLSFISFLGLRVREGWVCWKKLLPLLAFPIRLTCDWFLLRLWRDCAGFEGPSLMRPLDLRASLLAVALRAGLSARWNLRRQSMRPWLMSSDLVSMQSFLKRLRILNFWSLVVSAAEKLTAFSFSRRAREVGALSLLFLYLMSSRLNQRTSCSVCGCSCGLLLAGFSGKRLRKSASSFSCCICRMSWPRSSRTSRAMRYFCGLPASTSANMGVSDMPVSQPPSISLRCGMLRGSAACRGSLSALNIACEAALRGRVRACVCQSWGCVRWCWQRWSAMLLQKCLIWARSGRQQKMLSCLEQLLRRWQSQISRSSAARLADFSIIIIPSSSEHPY